MIQKALAQTIDPKGFNPAKTNFIEKFFVKERGDMDSLGLIIAWVIQTILLVAGGLAIIYFIYSGILYVTSAGNPDNVKRGTTGMIYAAIGIAVCVIVYYLVTAIAAYAGQYLGKTS